MFDILTYQFLLYKILTMCFIPFKIQAYDVQRMSDLTFIIWPGYS